MGKQVRKQKKSSIVAGGFLRFGLYVCVIIAVVYIGKSAFDFGYAIFNQVPMASEEDGRDITVVVEDGDSVYQIGKNLKNKGLIEDAKIFVIQEKLSNYKGKLQAGTYGSSGKREYRRAAGSDKPGRRDQGRQFRPYRWCKGRFHRPARGSG